MPETTISSFVLRFIHDPAADRPWQGIVRHVQSAEEARFTGIDEALRFISRYVEIGDELRPGMVDGVEG